VQVRTLGETVRLDARTKLLNPKWYEGMMSSGYEGVREIQKRLTNTMGWSATSGQVDNWVYDEANSTFIEDPEMAARLMEANPNRCMGAGFGAGQVLRMMELSTSMEPLPAPFSQMLLTCSSGCGSPRSQPICTWSLSVQHLNPPSHSIPAAASASWWPPSWRPTAAATGRPTLRRWGSFGIAPGFVLGSPASRRQSSA
jgi:hypothetical protein